MKCEYGCGREATYIFKNGINCCSENFKQCPSNRPTGNKNPRYGKIGIYKHSKETIEKMRLKKLGDKNIMFGKTHSSEAVKKIKAANIGRTRSMQSRIKQSLSVRGKNHPNYGNTADAKYYRLKYPTFAKVEEMREHYVTKEIQVHCKNHNCPNSKEKGGWFTPTRNQFYERIRQIENPEGSGGCYFYCSDECKQECPLFNINPASIINQNDLPKENYYTAEEYNTWRQEVLKRAEHICEYCGDKATDAHHSRPQKLEPFHSLDIDYGIACCEKCHYEKGHKDECSTGQLANTVCS